MSVYDKTSGRIKTKPAGFFSKIKCVFNCSYIYISISSKGKKFDKLEIFETKTDVVRQKKSKLFEKFIKFSCLLIIFGIVQLRFY